MPNWLRITRGLLGMGLTFAAGVGIVGSVISLPWLIAGGASGLEVLELVAKSAIWAFPIGMAFGGVLALAGRRLRFEELSLPRFAAFGAGAGLLLFGALAVNAHQAWSLGDAMGNAVILAFLGGGSATASLLIARKAKPKLKPGERTRQLKKE